jgi:outer membrane protein
MTVKSLVAATCVATFVLGAGSSAFAQAAAAPAAAAAPQVTHGPPIGNICVFSAENAIGVSTVGKYVGTRMQQIVAQVSAELNAEKTAVDNEAKTLEGQRASLDQATFQKRATDLNTKANNLQRKAALRDREVGATEQKAVGRVVQELEPLVRQAYQQKQCSLLLNGAAVTLANPAMDLTPSVVTALNAKITQFAFDREKLDQAPATAAQPAARR